MVKESINYDIVIYLVHGTFAKEAEWLKENSFLRTKLNLGIKKNILFVPFTWTGHNKFFDRFSESKNLQKKILKHKSIYPKAKHLAIGHSHGGNVILYSQNESTLDGIICMGTPFILASESENNFTSLNLVNSLLIVVLSFIIRLMIVISLGIFLLDKINGWLICFILVAVFLILRLINNKIEEDYIDYFVNKFTEAQNKIIKETTYPRIDFCEILNIQYKFDEAFLILKIINKPSYFFAKIAPLLLKYIFPLSCLVSFITISFIQDILIADWIDLLWVLLILVIFIIIWFLAIGGLVLFLNFINLFQQNIRLLGFVDKKIKFSIKYIFALFTLDIKISNKLPSPVEGKDIFKNIKRNEINNSIRHSKYYNDKNVISDIAKYIEFSFFNNEKK